MAWVCDRCHEPIRDIYQHVEKRFDYRMKRSQSRLASITIGHLHRECAEAEVEERRPSGKPSNDQGQLL